ncbi:NAD(P)-binding protein, partial [Lindgomyces ingoldianus]
SSNRVQGATYHAGDLTQHDQIKKLVDELKPGVIIHAASPSPVTGTPKEYENVNIRGTRNLLKAAKESEHVHAFIFTSSSTLAKGPEHLNLAEDWPLANTDPKSPPYAKSKAAAEIMVLDANNPATEGTTWAGHLATGSLRFPIIYGIREHTTIPGCLGALAKGQTNATLGDGKNLWDFCSASNCAVSHVLLASELLTSPGKTSGEAFNINDGSPYPFWSFARLCWKFAGWNPNPPPKVTNLPSWFALGLASFLEWVYWIFTFGTKRPYNLGKQQVEYACFTHTYSIEKAKTRLGYKPEVDFEVELKGAVEWCL